MFLAKEKVCVFSIKRQGVRKTKKEKKKKNGNIDRNEEVK